MCDILMKLTDEDLDRLEENMERAPAKFHGRHTRDDVRAEKRRRLAVHTTSYNCLVNEMSRSPDNLITYPEALLACHPGDKWHFRRSMRKSRKLMDDLLQFSVEYGKPIITV